jgi:alpha 1,2-mannosyltransferase
VVGLGLTERMTARNGDINGVTFSMKQLENNWNGKYHYPYVFLNDQPFSQEFKE